MILILSGLPASGKSTYARKWVDEESEDRVRINFDDLRSTFATWNGGSWLPFNWTNEKLVKAKALEIAEAAINEGKDIVVDNCNLTIRARQPWLDLATKHGVKVENEDFDVPLFTIVERDKKREARVGRAVIERMALTTGWIDWEDPDQYHPDDRFIIVDIDGTLSDTTHRLHFLDKRPKDWKGFFAEVGNDPPKPTIVELVKKLFVHYTVLIVSGRSLDQCGVATEDWLDQNLGPRYAHLFMRGSGDRRNDTIVKEEILEMLPRKERIAFVLDDRSSVVEMWRKNGLTCLQVARGDF